MDSDIDRDDPRYLREQAARCRRLAATCVDARSARTLADLATEYEQRAAAQPAAPAEAAGQAEPAPTSAPGPILSAS